MGGPLKACGAIPKAPAVQILHVGWLYSGALAFNDHKLRKLTGCTTTDANMISDDDLYRLAIFLGVAAMILIVVYHYLEVNADKTVAVPNLEEKAQVSRTTAGK